MAIPDYQMPDMFQKPERRLSFCREALQEGDMQLRTMKPFQDFSDALKMVAGEESDILPAKLSSVNTNRLKRQIREVVAILSQIRSSWFWESIDGEEQIITDYLNKTHRAWWSTTQAEKKLREATQWAAVTGTGYIHPRWRKDRWRYGMGDILLDVFGPHQVRQVQPVQNWDMQEAYMVIVTEEVPINRARALFPQYADQIRPDRAMATWTGDSKAQKLMKKMVEGFGSHVMRRFGPGRSQFEKLAQGKFPTVDIHKAYILDQTLNMTAKAIAMGEPGTTWEYVVPKKGDMIPTNVRDAQQNPLSREAGWEDTMLYPRRRMMQWTDTVILYDNTAPDWHGLVPIVPFKVDDWPWEMLGYGMYRNGAPLQKEMNKTLRGIGDKIQVQLRPGLMFDENAVNERMMMAVDTRQPGVRMKFNSQASQKPIESLIPPELLRLEPEALAYVDLLREELDHIAALGEMRNAVNASQVPSDRTMEKMLAMAGPLVQDMTGAIEKGMQQLGQMMGSNFFQYYDEKRSMHMIGRTALERTVHMFKPEELWAPSKIAIRDVNLGWQRFEAMRKYTHKFNLIVQPASLHAIFETQNKMLHFQLWRDPMFPLSPYTLAKVMGIQNFGSPPEGISTEQDMWKAWMKDSMEFQSMLQMFAMMSNPMAAMAGGGAPGGGGQEGPGRPPSGQQAPQLVSKSGAQGDRQVVTES